MLNQCVPVLARILASGTFTLTSDNSTIVTAGQTASTETKVGPTYQAFAAICPSPVSIGKKTTFQLSLQWLGGEDAVVIPFNGADTKDILTFDMTWTALRTVLNTHVIVDVDGLDVDVKHTCKFTQPDNAEITKTTDGTFVAGAKGRKLDCGVQPAGFALDETSAAVIFEIFVKGTKIKASYAGPAGEGPIVQLDTCLNSVKDGDETDEDCGGLCSGCPPEGACKVDTDCAGGIPCVDDACGVPGKSPGAAAVSCRALLDMAGGDTSGLFWIDPDGKGDPFEVYCDQKSAGGGWIMLQHLHDRRPSSPCGMNTEYRQAWDKWENDGIGTVQSYKGLNQAELRQSDKCHWLAFKNWGRIIGHSDAAGVVSQMKLVGDKGFNGGTITMNNFYVDDRERYKYGLRMSNYGEIRSLMCNGNDNCFASPNVGFSTGDKDRDSNGGHCSRDSYGGVGWWQAHCHYHHMTGHMSNNDQFTGSQGGDKRNQGTKHWTWFVR